jgi:hypothetical protein
VRLCLLVVVLSLSVPALLGACGESSAEDEITRVTEQFAADAEDKNWKGVCDALSADARAELAAAAADLGAGGCAAVMARLYALDDDPEILGTSGGEDITLSDVDVGEDRATAEVSPVLAGENPRVRYVREDGDWKLDLDPVR